MKSFFGWFKNSAKIKRWMLLMLLAMALVCFGVSKVLVLERLEFIDLAQVIASFVVGVVIFIIGMIRIQKRSLEIVIEANATNKDEENKEIDIKTLISKKNIYEKGPKVVVIGGGAGLNSVLRGLKKYTSNITAIVAVTGYGKEQEMSAKELKLKPIEDIKQSIIALSMKEEEMKRVMSYKFGEGRLKDLSFGDIYVSVMENLSGNFANSIEKTSDILSIVGRVLPVTLDEMKICAELQEGTVVQEKDKISEMVQDKITKIHRVYVNPSNCRTAPGVIEAINEAECIVIGPGSLYTNVIPNLLIKNVAKTIKESKAKKIYVSNIMTEPGQTDDYDVSDHIKAVLEHSGEGVIETCICDTGEIIPEFVRRYNLVGSNIVDTDTARIKETGVNFIKADLATIEGDRIRHDSDEIGKIIIELICDELKFRDEQQNEQYMLLNTKLKEEDQKKKEVLKEGKRKTLTHSRKGRNRRLSKFSTKYMERIKSIKNTEKSRQKNIKIHSRAQKLIEEEERTEKEKFLKETYKDTDKK